MPGLTFIGDRTSGQDVRTQNGTTNFLLVLRLWACSSDRVGVWMNLTLDSIEYGFDSLLRCLI